MKEVTQSITVGQIPGVPGNCLQAAVASFLDLPLEAVPHFLLWDSWDTEMRRWLEERGLRWTRVRSSYWPSQLAIVSGMSPRGVLHVVLAQDRRLLWDPHPSRDGLVTIRERWNIL